MAEYIDRERLKEVFNRNVVSAGVFNDIIDAQPTADVVELDKVNQARKEIADSVYRYIGSGNEVTQAYCDGLRASLAILDKLIEMESE